MDANGAGDEAVLAGIVDELQPDCADVEGFGAGGRGLGGALRNTIGGKGVVGIGCQPRDLVVKLVGVDVSAPSRLVMAEEPLSKMA